MVMTTESRLSRLEGAYEQVNERLADHIERFADISRRLDRLHEEIQSVREGIQSVRGEIQGLREEMNVNNAALRAEMNANIAGVRRESRWIGGIITAGIVVTVISIIVQPLL